MRRCQICGTTSIGASLFILNCKVCSMWANRLFDQHLLNRRLQAISRLAQEIHPVAEEVK
jgi:hypothetical protein